MRSHINSLPCHMVHTLTMYVDSTSHLLQLIIYCSLFERLQGVDLTSSYANRSKREWSCLRTLPRFMVSKTSLVVAVLAAYSTRLQHKLKTLLSYFSFFLCCLISAFNFCNHCIRPHNFFFIPNY